MSARPKPLETLNLSLAIPCESQSCKYSYKDALKKYKHQQLKDLK